MLVCGLTSVGAEYLRGLRRAVKQLGFVCEIEAGWCYFGEKEGRGDWDSLFRLLKGEVVLVPLYFMVGDRIIDLEYGKYCLNLSKNGALGAVLLASWKGILASRVRMMAAGISMIQKKVSNGDN